MRDQIENTFYQFTWYDVDSYYLPDAFDRALVDLKKQIGEFKALYAEVQKVAKTGKSPYDIGISVI